MSDGGPAARVIDLVGVREHLPILTVHTDPVRTPNGSDGAHPAADQPSPARPSRLDSRVGAGDSWPAVQAGRLWVAAR